jgi:hypothetical protein
MAVKAIYDRNLLDNIQSRVGNMARFAWVRSHPDGPGADPVDNVLCAPWSLVVRSSQMLPRACRPVPRPEKIHRKECTTKR